MTGFFSFSRAAPSITVLALVILFIVPTTALSWWLVRKKRALRAHKTLQIMQFAILGMAILAFEFEIRRHDWRAAAEMSPYYDLWVQPALVVHLACAFPCAVLWCVTLTGAVRFFPRPVRSSSYAEKHRKLGRLTALFTFATAVTGWGFFWLAFVS